MGLFEMLEFYLKDFYETILAYAKARLLLVSGKNADFGNSGTLMLILISCWNEFSFFERDLAVGGKDLKIGGIELNNWWKENIILVGQSSVLCKRLIKLFFCIFVRNF